MLRGQFVSRHNVLEPQWKLENELLGLINTLISLHGAILGGWLGLQHLNMLLVDRTTQSSTSSAEPTNQQTNCTEKFKTEEIESTSDVALIVARQQVFYEKEVGHH